MGELCCGSVKRNVCLTNPIQFLIVKNYPEIRGVRYVALRIYDNQKLSAGITIVRKLCRFERRCNFKYSTVIESSDQFFIVVGKAVNEASADIFFENLLNYQSKNSEQW